MNRLKKLRTEKRLTQRQLANILHISHSNLCLLENGQRGLSQELISIICDFFGCTADYLLGLSDNKNTIVVHRVIPEDVKLAFYSQKGITDKQDQDYIESFIDFIKSRQKK